MNSNGQKHYSVLTREEIREKMMKEVAHISELFSLSMSNATVILIHLRWDTYKVIDLLGDNIEDFLLKLGLVGSNQSPTGEGDDNLVSTPFCSHSFTKDCWRNHLRESLVKKKKMMKEDEEGLLISCISQDCIGTVGPDTIEKLGEPAKEIYVRYLLETFMESKKDSIKWCPDPDCDYAIEQRRREDREPDCDDAIEREDEDPSSEDFDVVCLCGHIFCWSCKLESHRPVTCNNASLWLNKLLEESRALAKIAEKIKHCPKCYSRVENQDGVWKCIPCNASSPSNELALITHLALWDASHAEINTSKDDLKAIKERSTRLAADCGLGELDMEALREAWMLTVQCRLVLKWSCVFGYFITDYHSAKKDYLEYQVEIATSHLSRHKKTLDEVTSGVILRRDINAFRQILGDTTTRTGNYFQRFAKALEDGLLDIKVNAYGNGTSDYWFCDRCTNKNYSFQRECRVCVGPSDSPRHGQGETNPWEKRNSSGLAITIPLRFCLSLIPELPDHSFSPSIPRKAMNSNGQRHYSVLTRAEIREKMMKEMYDGYVVESFVESKKESIKWCPKPDCDFAIERNDVDHPSEEDFGVVCLCGHRFCWSCLLEPHRPVTCDNASLWLNKLLEESRTLARLAQTITHCPECDSLVENQDGVWKCIQCKASSPSNESALITHLALWDACHEEIQTSKGDVKDFEQDITRLTTDCGLGELDMKALREAWMLIVQYNRVLKWSCVFSYFITDHHSAKKEYLNHLRNDATAHLHKHKETLDEVMYRVMSAGDLSTAFRQTVEISGGDLSTAFRQIVGDTTTRTDNYFDFFLKTLEYGFE